MAAEERKPLHLEGTVEHVMYCNAENGYTVLELDAGGTLITVVGEMGETEEGEQLSVDGEYTTHPRYGMQFRAQYWERKLPADALNIQRYLSSGAIKGIGSSLAKKIVENFGDHTLEIMEKEPTRLLEIRGISPKKCESIAAEVKQIFSLRTLMLFLAQYDIRSKYAMRAYQKWGNGAIDLLAANPYLLCVPGVELDFLKADAVAQGMQFAQNAPQRVQAGIIYILQYNTNNGNSCLPLDRLRPKACAYLKVNEADFEIAYAGALDEHTLCVYEKNGRDYVYLEDYYIAEHYIADRIGVIQDFSAPEDNSEFEKMIDAQEQEQGMEYAALQRKAIVTALSRGIMILTGGPGTGKTTTLNGIISLYEKQGYRVMIAAPTGRAASRISDLTGYEASTIHRMLEVEYDASGGMGFQHDERNPLECDVMVVDEMSMVDVLLFEHLLRALRLSCKVVLVGDCDQLPSVGAGNLLRDLIDSGRVPVVALKEIFRQAQKSSIITNAHKIIGGEYPDLTQKKSDCFFFQRLKPDAATELMLELVKTRLPKAYGYSPMEDIQVITPSRKGVMGVIELNQRLQAVLNPPSPSLPEVKSMLYTFREGDKVMQIKNNYDIIWHKDGENGTGIFNGDIGYLRAINRQTQEVVAEFDGRRATYPFEQLDQLELAYAVTVHKSQGSEFQAVVMPLLGGFPKLYYRNLLYTAVTRARRLLIMIGSQKVIYQMVENNRRMNRYTCLRDMLEQQKSTAQTQRLEQPEASGATEQDVTEQEESS
ncbi:SF1B family DNA helicase RecD2 [Ruminococcus sp.]